MDTKLQILQGSAFAHVWQIPRVGVGCGSVETITFDNNQNHATALNPKPRKNWTKVERCYHSQN